MCLPIVGNVRRVLVARTILILLCIFKVDTYVYNRQSIRDNLLSALAK